MLRNYLKTAWRTLFKNKALSLINILGLSLGMACSLLIMLWVHDERSMDGFHPHDANLFSVFERQYHDGMIEGGHSTPGLLADEMKLKFPEVQYATGMGWSSLYTFDVNGKILQMDGNFAGEDFFRMFNYPLIVGNPAVALQSTLDIAISRKMAEDFFGSPEKAIGQGIRWQNKKDMKVTAVFENVPARSSKKFDFLLNWQTFLEENDWAKDWGNNGPPTYITLRNGSDANAFRGKIRNFIATYADQENFRIELDIQKYSDIYLHSNFKNGEIEGGRIQYVVLFSIVAIFILLIACINFMNLSTARSIKRAKEIGVRKVVGALRGSLIRQFIGEALLTVIIAFVLALTGVALLLPVFNEVTRKLITIPSDSLPFWLSLGVLTVITGIIAGSYPALYLSSFKPAGVLKGAIRFGKGALWLRKGLVVFQFSLSIILIVGTIIITKQVSYVQSVNLGYDRQNLIYVPLEGDLVMKYSLFKNQLLGTTGINSITRISQTPTRILNSTGGVQWEGKDPNAMLQFTQVAVGYDFMKTMKAQLSEGRDFSRDFPSDSTGYLVNESAVKLFNYENPIGMPLTFWGKKGTIVGVVKDFHINSMHVAIMPMIFRLRENWEDGGAALVRTEPGKTKEALASLEKICKTLNPRFPFAYQFSDEEYGKLYASEQTISKLSNVFGFLGIFISCLGLLGLTMFTTEQRTKEIGIRKVLGASMISLFNLLSRELLVLVSFALVIATPLAWIAMNNWLNNYAYHIGISWWMFVLAGAMAILIALFTISFQTMKALLENPANSLKAE